MKNIVKRSFLDSLRFPVRHKIALRDYLVALDSIAEEAGITDIWLFGSCAREEATAWSDVDLLVLVKGKLPEDMSRAKFVIYNGTYMLAEDPEVQLTIRFTDTFWDGTDFFTKSVKKDALQVAKYE